jgi:hypothetical protein
MTGKIKALGLAFIATTMMSAIVASGAQAGSFDFGVKPSVFKADTSGEPGESVFTLTSTSGSKFNASCPSATLEGTVNSSNPVTDITLTPTFGPFCISFGLAATVVTNGCKLTLTGVGAAARTFKIDFLLCTAGKQIEIKTALCTLDIGEQTELQHIVATNLNPTEVTLSTTVSEMKVTQTGAACPDGNGHVSTNMAWTINTIAKAFTDTGSTTVTKHGHQYSEYTAGAQTTITAT